MNDIHVVPNGQLGTGGFGAVCLITIKNNPKKYAMKKVDLTHLLPMEVEHIKQEIKHHLNLIHPNIIKFHHAIYVGSELVMILDVAPNGDLYNKMQTVKKFDEYNAAKILWQLLQALIYIHDKFIIHRDLKPENIQLDENNNCLLTDFGWSGEFDTEKRRQTYCGTYEYMAPEIVTGANQSDKTDIWSLGIIAYEQLHGKTPFVSSTAEEINSKTQQGSIPINKALSNEIKTFIKKTQRHHPENRLSGKELQEHPLFIKHRFATENLKVSIDFKVPSPTKKDEVRRPNPSDSPNYIPKTIVHQKSLSQTNLKVVSRKESISNAEKNYGKISNENIVSSNNQNQTLTNDFEHHKVNTDVYGKQVNVLDDYKHKTEAADKYKVMYVNNKNNNVKKYITNAPLVKQSQTQVISGSDYSQPHTVIRNNYNPTELHTNTGLNVSSQQNFKKHGDNMFASGTKTFNEKLPINYNDTTYGKTSVYNDTTYGKTSAYNDTTYGKTSNYNDATYVKQSNYNDTTYVKQGNYNDTTYVKQSNHVETTHPKTNYYSNTTYPVKSNLLKNPTTHYEQSTNVYYDQQNTKPSPKQYHNNGYAHTPSKTIYSQHNPISGTKMSGSGNIQSSTVQNEPKHSPYPHSTTQSLYHGSTPNLHSSQYNGNNQKIYYQK